MGGARARLAACLCDAGVDEMRRDGDLDPRLVVERRAAGGRRLRRMALPCVFVGQLLLFVTYVYWSYPASEERPRQDPRNPHADTRFPMHLLREPNAPLPPIYHHDLRGVSERFHTHSLNLAH